jgi:hypothetical protein
MELHRSSHRYTVYDQVAMSDSCSLCGLILATQDSDYPKWCKAIRAYKCILRQ